MSFGEKLSILRKEKGMSQEDLASNLNVSRQAVSKWESNNSYPETEKIVAICKLFNCSMDELIGLKEKNDIKNENLFNKVTKFFDLFIKSIKLFYSMTFKQKIKCLFEMSFYTLILFLILLILNNTLLEIFRNLFYLIPDELLYILIQTFRGILYLISLLIVIYVLVKLYRIRYLDYYEEYSNDINNLEKEVEKKEDKEINIKEEKIIIRDPEKDFKPFDWLKNILLYFIKFIALSITFGLSLAFVILIACSIFILYFINHGLLIVYIVIGLFGAILGIYVILEILIKFIFNMKQSLKRLFVMFILSIFIVGISGGLFTSEITTYSIIGNINFNDKLFEETIKMNDKLIFDFLNDDTEIIIEDREDILIEVYGMKSDLLNIKIISHETNESYYCSNNILKNNYGLYSYYYNYDLNGKSINEIINEVLKIVDNKQIITDDIFYNTVPKIHISESNYQILLNNYSEYYNTESICE